MEKQMTFDALPTAVHQILKKIDTLAMMLESSKPDEQQNKLLTIQQAAEFLNLSKSTIYSKVSRGELPHMKKGKRLYFFQKELTAYIKSGKVKTVADLENEADDYLSNCKNSYHD